jgi:hypothetical protein
MIVAMVRVAFDPGVEAGMATVGGLRSSGMGRREAERIVGWLEAVADAVVGLGETLSESVVGLSS